MIPCGSPIELDGGKSVTYCALPQKHDGPCRPGRPPCSLCRALTEYWRKVEEADALRKRRALLSMKLGEGKK